MEEIYIIKGAIILVVFGIVMMIVNRFNKHLDSYDNVENPDGTIYRRKKVEWKGSTKQSFKQDLL